MNFSGNMCFKILLKITKSKSSTLSIVDTFFKKPQGGSIWFRLGLSTADSNFICFGTILDFLYKTDSTNCLEDSYQVSVFLVLFLKASKLGNSL